MNADEHSYRQRPDRSCGAYMPANIAKRFAGSPAGRNFGTEKSGESRDKCYRLQCVRRAGFHALSAPDAPGEKILFRQRTRGTDQDRGEISMKMIQTGERDDCCPGPGNSGPDHFAPAFENPSPA